MEISRRGKRKGMSSDLHRCHSNSSFHSSQDDALVEQYGRRPFLYRLKNSPPCLEDGKQSPAAEQNATILAIRVEPLRDGYNSVDRFISRNRGSVCKFILLSSSIASGQLERSFPEMGFPLA